MTIRGMSEYDSKEMKELIETTDQAMYSSNKREVINLSSNIEKVVKKFILKYFIFFNLFMVISGKDDKELALDYFMQGQFY